MDFYLQIFGLEFKSTKFKYILMADGVGLVLGRVKIQAVQSLVESMPVGQVYLVAEKCKNNVVIAFSWMGSFVPEGLICFISRKLYEGKLQTADFWLAALYNSWKKWLLIFAAQKHYNGAASRTTASQFWRSGFNPDLGCCPFGVYVFSLWLHVFPLCAPFVDSCGSNQEVVSNVEESRSVTVALNDVG